jgi:hypothetical protein
MQQGHGCVLSKKAQCNKVYVLQTEVYSQRDTSCLFSQIVCRIGKAKHIRTFKIRYNEYLIMYYLNIYTIRKEIIKDKCWVKLACYIYPLTNFKLRSRGVAKRRFFCCDRSCLSCLVGLKCFQFMIFPPFCERLCALLTLAFLNVSNFMLEDRQTGIL